MTTTIQSSIQSAIQTIPKTIISTIPYTYWINSGTTTTYPFYYASTFQVTSSTIQSPIQETFTSTFQSNIFAPPVVLYPSSTPIYPNPVLSTYIYTFQSTIPSFLSTSTSFGTIVSTGVLAASYPFDFTSTCYVSAESYPAVIPTPNVWLGDTLSQLIQSKQYSIAVNCQYSLRLDSETTRYAFVDTVGYLGNVVGSLNNSGLTGQRVTTRVGVGTYTQITNTFIFTPDQENQIIGINAANFFLSIVLNRSPTETSLDAPDYDIYIPGNNNFTFTLIPI